MLNCRNCEKLMTAEMQFCTYCGQKNTDGKIKVWSFLTVFVNQVFNIESKLFKTFRDLFIPGKLTVEYFKGKHKTYFHPLRMLIVLLVLYLAFTSFFQFDLNEFDFNKTFSNKLVSSPSFYKKTYYSILLHQLDSLNSENYQIKKYDSTTYTNIQQLICDTLQKYENPSTKKISGRNIEKIDLIELDGQEIIEKYNIKGFYTALEFKQRLKLFKGGFNNGVNFFFTNAFWVFLLMMPFVALILMLFYYKQHYYYVEHLVFSFHIHGFVFLLFTVDLLLLYFLRSRVFYIIEVFVVSIYILLALKKVYRQNWRITLLKFLGISLNYAILSFLFFMLFLFFTYMLY